MSAHSHNGPEVIDIRPAEQLNRSRLDPWLREHVPGIDSRAAINIRQFGGGHANLTYLVCVGSLKFVLRRPPLGPIAPRSHDMRREHRILSQLHHGFPLAPRSLAVCTDHGVLGCDFHIMERRVGFVIRRALPPNHRGRPELNRRISAMLVDTLAALHRVDPASVGLGDLGHPAGFAARQVSGWTTRWRAAADRDRPAVERMATWLTRDTPSPSAVTLLHSDYKLDNILVDTTDPATPIAVLDWDMATRGDPLMDLGYLLTFWSESADDPRWIRATGMPTTENGWMTREEVVARYAALTGFDVAHVEWHQVFSIFKLIVILQQIYIRYLRGQTSDERFATFGVRIDNLADKGTALLG